MIRAGILGLLTAAIVAGQAPNEATLSGRIVDAATRQPIPGVRISYNTTTVDSSVVSDETGAYSIHISLSDAPVRTLPLSLKVTRPGYAGTSVGYQSAISLRRGDVLTRDFELRPAARITGRVLDRDTDEPVAGISVMALREFRPDRISRYDSSPTGADGSFSIADMDADEYRLEFNPPRTARLLPGDPKPTPPVYATTWFPGVPRAEMSTTLRLAAGESQSIEVRMQKRALHYIAGIVEFPEGMDPQEVEVELTLRAGGIRDLHGDFARGGKFHADGLEEGSYVVHASTSAKSPSDRYYASHIVELTDRDIDDFKLVLRRSVTLHDVFTMAEENVPVPKSLFVIHGPLDHGRDRPRTSAPMNGAAFRPANTCPW